MNMAMVRSAEPPHQGQQNQDQQRQERERQDRLENIGLLQERVA